MESLRGRNCNSLTNIKTSFIQAACTCANNSHERKIKYLINKELLTYLKLQSISQYRVNHFLYSVDVLQYLQQRPLRMKRIGKDATGKKSGDCRYIRKRLGLSDFRSK
jgi:hypothetical protein